MTELFKAIHDLNQDDAYSTTYDLLKSWIDSSLDFYQNDLRKVMGPIFIYMYISMIQKDMQESAENFYKDYSIYHWSHSDLEKLAKIQHPGDDLGIFSHKYHLTMQSYSYSQLIHFVETHELVIILSILNKNLEISLTPKSSQAVLLGKELKIQQNKFHLSLDDPKPSQKLPLPSFALLQDLRSQECDHKRDLSSHIPDIVCFTVRNANEALCMDITEDSLLIACGFEDSVIRTFATQGPGILDTLIGHSGAVFSVSFSPDSTLLVSGSEDCSIRLWSLLHCACLAEFTAHTAPVWTVKFGPLGYYFASGGNDKAAYVWSTEWVKPLRMLVGHHSDVVAVAFHHKGGYVATGSTDKTVRVWDVVTAECLRIFTGFGEGVGACCFSRSGKAIIAGDNDGDLMCWDINRKEVLWVAKVSGGIECIAVCYGDNSVIVGNDDKSVYAVDMKGEVLAAFKSKVQILCTGFSYRNLGVACGIARINNKPGFN